MPKRYSTPLEYFLVAATAKRNARLCSFARRIGGATAMDELMELYLGIG